MLYMDKPSIWNSNLKLTLGPTLVEKNDRKETGERCVVCAYIHICIAGDHEPQLCCVFSWFSTTPVLSFKPKSTSGIRHHSLREALFFTLSPVSSASVWKPACHRIHTSWASSPHRGKKDKNIARRPRSEVMYPTTHTKHTRRCFIECCNFRWKQNDQGVLGGSMDGMGLSSPLEKSTSSLDYNKNGNSPSPKSIGLWKGRLWSEFAYDVFISDLMEGLILTKSLKKLVGLIDSGALGIFKTIHVYK